MLKFILIALLSSLCVLANAVERHEIETMISEVANKKKIDPVYLKAMIQHESRMNPFAINISKETFQPESKEQAINLLRNIHYKPWMVKIDNETRFLFSSKGNAENYKEFLKKQGKASRVKKLTLKALDVGLGQLNYFWHGKYFSNVDEMFDPQKNLEYAASYLQKMTKAAGGDERLGLAFYHNMKSKRLQEAYLKHVDYWLNKYQGTMDLAKR